MKYHLHRELDLILESVSILIRIYNKGYTDLVERIKSRLGESEDDRTFGAFLDKYLVLCETIAAAVDLSDPLAAQLLCKRDGVLPLATALWWYQHIAASAETEVEDVASSARSSIRSSRSPEMVDRIYSCLAILPSLSDDYSSEIEIASHPDGLIGWLEEQIPMLEDRYDMLRFYTKFEEYVGYFMPLVSRVSELIRGYLPHLEDEIALQTEKLAQAIGDQGIGFLESWVNIKLDDDEDLYAITPTLDFSIAIFNRHEGSIRMCFRIYLHEMRRFRGDTVPNAQIAEFVKAIADPTKLSILTLLKEEERYAGQLATALSLSSPTISHHMNALVQLQLVNLEKRGNRVFYELNREMVSAYLQGLDLLLGDDKKNPEEMTPGRY